jgi:DNA polymerase-3 subunit delta'
MKLEQVIGQKNLKIHLTQLLSEGVPGHAYAFCGQRGIGRKTLARAFASHWICEKNQMNPCGVCRSCTTFAAGTHPDVYSVFPDKDKIQIDAIREMQQHLSINPIYGRKLYMIHEADLMNEAAQNCLLKTLEEPPPKTLLIMTAVSFEKLLPTIRSRTVKLALERYNHADLKEILSKNKMSGHSSDFLLSFSQGVPGRAMELIKSASLEKNREIVLNILPLPGKNPFEGVDALWQYLSENKDYFFEIHELLLGLLRDVLLVIEGDKDRLINSDKKDMIVKVASICNQKKMVACILELEDIRSSLQENLNFQIAIDALAVSLSNGFNK